MGTGVTNGAKNFCNSGSARKYREILNQINQKQSGLPPCKKECYLLCLKAERQAGFGGAVWCTSSAFVKFSACPMTSDGPAREENNMVRDVCEKGTITGTARNRCCAE